MSKQILIVLGVLCIQICTSFGVENSKVDKRDATGEEIKLDDRPYGIAEAINSAKEAITEGQRQKRFFDYVGYSTGASSFSSIYPSAQSYATSDAPYGTNIPNEQTRLNEILRVLRNLAEITRPQYSQPTHHNSHFPIFIPFNFPPPPVCTCPPSNANTPPAPTTIKPPVGSTYLPPSTDKPATMPDSFLNRLGEDATKNPNNDFSDDYDGVRPISLEPIPPKVPLGVPVPDVEHGSFQAGLNPPPPNRQPAAASNQNWAGGPAEIPTVCEGAILTCCHRPDPTNDCFAKEGCGEIEYGNPCDTKVLSSIASKILAYIKQRG